MDGREPLWLGIDVGTQSLKVAAVDHSGELVAAAAVQLESRRTGERHEQDPEAWWTALSRGCRQALAEVDGSRLGALSICSTSGTILLMGAGGEALTAGLMYDDARAAGEAGEVAQAGTEVWDRLGYAMQPTWALPRLLWLLRSPQFLGQAEGDGVRLAHCADFLVARLVGGRVPTDWSHALKTGYDLDRLCWPAEVLDRLGIPRGLLPEVVRPGTDLGSVSAEAARETGLPEGLPVRAGMTDGCAAQVAAGALQAGRWNSVLGTTLVIKGVTGERLADPSGAVYSHRHPDGGWLPGGASNVGAGAIAAEFPSADLAHLEKLAARHEPASEVVYPLGGTGERFPFVAPDARRFASGELRDAAERYAALLQGVAFTERLCYDRLAGLGADVSGPVAITGGATHSRYWNQLRANVLGRPLELPRYTEAAVGMAVVAAAGTGSVSEAAQRMISIAEIIEPEARAAERFRPTYTRFVDELVARRYLTLGQAVQARERWAA